jgi:hypothetical protein
MEPKILFDRWQRQDIIEFYQNYPNGSYWNKPHVVAVFELLKAVRNFKRDFVNGLKIKITKE